MKEKIEKINNAIDEKRERLKEKAERYFAVISVPSAVSNNAVARTTETKKTPLLSYILYGVTGLSAIGAFMTDASESSSSKILLLGVAVASAIGGFAVSKSAGQRKPTGGNAPAASITTVRNEVEAKVLDAVKKVTNEWEEFMELKQKDLRLYIEASQQDNGRKDTLLSKIFLYEIIDISTNEFYRMITAASTSAEIKQQLEAYRAKLFSAIDRAADKQKAKYRSLCEA